MLQAPRLLLHVGSETGVFSGASGQFRAPCASRHSFRPSCARRLAFAVRAQRRSSLLRSTLSLSAASGSGFRPTRRAGSELGPLASERGFGHPLRSMAGSLLNPSRRSGRLSVARLGCGLLLGYTRSVPQTLGSYPNPASTPNPAVERTATGCHGPCFPRAAPFRNLRPLPARGAWAGAAPALRRRSPFGR